MPYCFSASVMPGGIAASSCKVTCADAGATCTRPMPVVRRAAGSRRVMLTSSGAGGSAALIWEHLAAAFEPALCEDTLVERCRLCSLASSRLGEPAVLRIVGNEVRQHGRCNRCVDEIAARAGVCRSLVKSTIRHTLVLRRLEPERNLARF